MPADVAVPRPRPADQDRFRAAVADALDRLLAEHRERARDVHPLTAPLVDAIADLTAVRSAIASTRGAVSGWTSRARSRCSASRRSRASATAARKRSWSAGRGRGTATSAGMAPP